MEPALGRFTTMDPMAEKYYSWSPYHYAANNPMRITDPNGKDWRDFLIGVGTGIVNSLQATGYAITHPIETIKNLSQASFEDRKAMAVDNATLGNLSFIQTAVTDIQSGNGSATGKAIGSIATQVGMAAATARVGSAIGKGISGVGKVTTNQVPSKLARVIPENVKTNALGSSGVSDVFVTAAEDIRGLNTTQISKRLTIPSSKTGFKVIEFKTPLNGLSSPVNRSNPGFVGGGKTAGGAREFTIPNQLIPTNSTIRIVK